MTDEQTTEGTSGPVTPEPSAAPGGKLCNADRMQRRHCSFYHEQTGRCMQTGTATWQARAQAAPPSSTAGENS